MSSPALHYDYPTTSAYSRTFSFSRLRETIKQTNSRIRRILPYWRDCNQPTHHAKRRATSLNLRVDTVKAYNCDHRNVSTIPLPILELDPSPPAAQLVYPEGCKTTQPEEADVGVKESRSETDSDTAMSVSSPSFSQVGEDATQVVDGETYDMDIVPQPAEKATAVKPILHCTIPLTQCHVPVERSYFSADSDDCQHSAVTLSCPSNEMVDSPASALPAPRPIYPCQRGLSLPQDIDDKSMSWGSGEVASLHSPSSSSDSSSGPLTPQEAQPKAMAPVAIRIKRKSHAMDEDEDDASSCDEIRRVFDKRPKFERKRWAGIVEGGQPIRRPAAPAPVLWSPGAKRHASAPADASRVASPF